MQSKITSYYPIKDEEDNEYLLDALEIRSIKSRYYSADKVQFVIYLYLTKYDIIENKYPFKRAYTLDHLSQESQIPKTTCISFIDKCKLNKRLILNDYC